MKTFADLKRDLQVGKKLKMIYHHWENTRTNKILNIEREIIKVQSNGVSLKTNNQSGKSFLDLPCASLTEYDGKNIKIYGIGKRPLTTGEKALLDNEPSRRPENAKMVERDVLSDGSSTYYLDKSYYSKNNANWRYDWDKGLKLDINDYTMFDKKIKGKLELEYILS